MNSLLQENKSSVVYSVKTDNDRFPPCEIVSRVGTAQFKLRIDSEFMANAICKAMNDAHEFSARDWRSIVAKLLSREALLLNALEDVMMCDKTPTYEVGGVRAKDGAKPTGGSAWRTPHEIATAAIRSRSKLVFTEESARKLSGAQS